MPKRRAETQLTKDSINQESNENQQEQGETNELADAETLKGRKIIKIGDRKRRKKAPKDATQAAFQFSFAPQNDTAAKQDSDAAKKDTAKQEGFQFSFTPQQQSTTGEKKDSATKPVEGGFQFSFAPQNSATTAATTNSSDDSKKTNGDSSSTTTTGFKFSFDTTSAGGEKDSKKEDNASSAPSSTSEPKQGSGFAFSFASIAKNDTSSPASTATPGTANPSEWNFSFAPSKVVDQEKKDNKQEPAKSEASNYESKFGSINPKASWTERENYTPSEDRSSKVDTVKLGDKPAETGEEGENTIIECPLKLFELVDKEWKERGVGTLKLNEKDKKNARLIMRTKQTQIVKLNARLFAGMPHTKQGDKSLILMLNNAAAPPGSEGKSEDKAEVKLSQYLLRTKEAAHIDKIFNYIETNFKKE